MRSAVILHGICDEDEYFDMVFPSPSNAHWLPWLQQKFLRKGILCQTLEMPTPYAPQYEMWRDVFKQIQLQNDTIIVGHSAGAGFILKWLSENPHVFLQSLILVAPYLDPKRTKGSFLECNLDKNLSNRVNEIHVFYSSDEKVAGIKESVELILETYPNAILHQCHDKGHFCIGHMGSPEFPELFALIQ